MDLNVYLTFRSYWNDYRPEDVSFEDLGLSQKDVKEAKARLKRSSPYKEYLADIDAFSNRGRPLGKLADLGAFTLVRHFQQQITNTDREDAAEKVIVTPIRTRSRSAALDAAAAGKQVMRQPNFQPESLVPRGPSPTESYSSSDGDPMDQESPSPSLRAANRANITH
ncbi:conserved hypothetical protein [Histoplasma capsulatum var. duboisii H88]|uniref:Uncharacterized protein n=1 Tax=Ajellomyces capsulatus (strain H88) TaxID=544711 RepID=F0UTP6_AJEC8|nr:conserved hypothetical protein [Histoplasma capsulatum var. duboisii H88]QSS57897.1 hypothetical protein I7I53_12226 [Histoplasma capsulatum var. duboisii H88]